MFTVDVKQQHNNNNNKWQAVIPKKGTSQSKAAEQTANENEVFFSDVKAKKASSETKMQEFMNLDRDVRDSKKISIKRLR